MTDSNNMVMPVMPSGGFGGFGGGGDSWGWIILLLLIAGGGFGFGGGFDGAGAIYPWMNQADITTNGFQNAALGTGISGIQNAVTSGFGDIQTALCGGFAGVNASISNGFSQSEISANARQMADMQQMFNVQSALQNCCCENRASVADLKYTVATENCADRAAISDGIRNVMENCNRNNQAILDKLCQLELDGKQDRINELERQLTMANLQASQTAQTAKLVADNTAQTQYIVNRVAPYPIPAYVVANPVTPAA